MIGQKGLPATFGGIERHVEELGSRLAGLGHEITVFTRPQYSAPGSSPYKGMTLRSMPTLRTKHLDAIVHSVLCSFACWTGGYDVVHYHAIGPGLASPIARVRGRVVVATVHGQDWRRGKWGRAASAVLRLGEWMTLRVPHATISVSESLARHYHEQSGAKVTYIPNGISIDPGDDTRVLEEFGLGDGGFLLFAGRLVPEKGAHHLIEAYASSGLSLPLVIAGDTSHSDEYVARLKAMACDGVVFTGYQYGERLASLFRHAALFVLPSDLEGLPIVLLEALAYGAPVLASDIAPNVEVLGENGAYFSAGNVEDLRRALVRALADTDALRRAAQERRPIVEAEYDWDRVARLTSDLYEALAAKR